VNPTALAVCVLVPLGLAQSVGALQAPDDVRRQIESLADSVDGVMRLVSRPSPVNLFGPAQMTRGYRIPGMGVVLVVPARSLPGRPGPGATATQSHPGPGRPALAARGGSRGLTETEDERALRAFEELVRMMQASTIRSQQEAERNFEQFQQRMMRDASSQTPPNGGAQQPPPTGTGQDGTLLFFPPTPPWAQFFEETPETRTPRQVLDDVRGALVDVLPAKAPGFLAEDEWIVVTVDFFEDDVLDFVARPASTLVARVRARDVVARRSGTLSVEDFRKRIEYSEIP
jgi:hypothetical protein